MTLITNAPTPSSFRTIMKKFSRLNNNYKHIHKFKINYVPNFRPSKIYTRNSRRSSTSGSRSSILYANASAADDDGPATDDDGPATDDDVPATDDDGPATDDDGPTDDEPATDHHLTAGSAGASTKYHCEQFGQCSSNRSAGWLWASRLV